MASERTTVELDGCTPEHLAAEVERRWFDRLDRAGGLAAPAVGDLYYELLDAVADNGKGPKFVLGECGWVENPHYGDGAFYLAEQRRLWEEIGWRLQIGPAPASFFEVERSGERLLPPSRVDHRAVVS